MDGMFLKGVLTGTTASSQKGRWWLLSAAVAAIQLFFKKKYTVENLSTNDKAKPIICMAHFLSSFWNYWNAIGMGLAL